MGVHINMKIEIDEGHIVLVSKHFKDGFFCLNCSLFNPRILFYELQERLR